MTYVFVIIHTRNLVQHFREHTAQTETFSRIKEELNDKGAFNLKDNNYSIIITDTVEYPNGLGFWSATQIEAIDGIYQEPK